MLTATCSSSLNASGQEPGIAQFALGQLVMLLLVFANEKGRCCSKKARLVALALGWCFVDSAGLETAPQFFIIRAIGNCYWARTGSSHLDQAASRRIPAQLLMIFLFHFLPSIQRPNFPLRQLLEPLNFPRFMRSGFWFYGRFQSNSYFLNLDTAPPWCSGESPLEFHRLISALAPAPHPLLLSTST